MSRWPAWARRTSGALGADPARRQDRTVLMVEHNLSVVADLSDRLTVLARGEILAEGTYRKSPRTPGGGSLHGHGP
jgi:ABC-type multidrug transport system ATPase subunit